MIRVNYNCYSFFQCKEENEEKIFFLQLQLHSESCTFPKFPQTSISKGHILYHTRRLLNTTRPSRPLPWPPNTPQCGCLFVCLFCFFLASPMAYRISCSSNWTNAIAVTQAIAVTIPHLNPLEHKGTLMSCLNLSPMFWQVSVFEKQSRTKKTNNWKTN